MTSSAVILVETQLSQNIGKSARAMLNFGLTDLRLVRPKAQWLNQDARSLAAGADEVLENARVYDSVLEATHDLQHIFATTARPRDMIKTTLTPRALGSHIKTLEANRCGVIFGPERCGLDNQDVALAEAVVSVPLNPEFSSLNVAQAVAIVSYEIFQAGVDETAIFPQADVLLASMEDLAGLFTQLEDELEKAGYFRNAHMRPTMTQNLRNMFARMPFSAQEIRTFRGVVSALVNPNGIHSRGTKVRKK